MYEEDTIAAIATPSGEGGIAIIRISGMDAENIATKIFARAHGKNGRLTSHRLYHGAIYNPKTNGKVDEVLLTIMRKPRSYTGEDVVEIHCHGGAFLVRMEFPRRMPDIGIASRDQLPDEMPDYDYDLVLQDGQLIVKGKCTDEKVRKISSSVGAFPPEFTTVIPFRQRIAGIAHQFENKLLQVLVVKA